MRDSGMCQHNGFNTFLRCPRIVFAAALLFVETRLRLCDTHLWGLSYGDEVRVGFPQGKTNETLCGNNMQILKLLSEEVSNRLIYVRKQQ